MADSCFFCGTNCAEKSESLGSLIKASRERGDSWLALLRNAQRKKEKVTIHSECRRLYTHPSEIQKFLAHQQVQQQPAVRKRGRPIDNEKQEPLSKIRKFIEDSDDSQFSLNDLINYFGESKTYTPKHFMRKLAEMYGNSVTFTHRPGRPCIVNFNDCQNDILFESWKRKKKNNSEERTKIVEEAAAIIREDIRNKTYQCDVYQSPRDLDDESLIPESLKIFLEKVLQSKKNEGIARKRAAIAQAIISTCRPRSFVSPILLGVGVYAHRHFASKELVNTLNRLSFSVDYKEVMRYEYSVMMAKNDGSNISQNASYEQYAFDNADFNVKTMTGHGTFHSMGGIRLSTPAQEDSLNAIPRILNVPSAIEIASAGTIPITWYKKPPTKGLKSVKIKPLIDVGQEMKEFVRTALTINSLSITARWAGVPSPPAWNGFMRKVFNSGEMLCERTKIEALPFVNLNPSDDSTIYTALLFAKKECSKIGQESCCVVFDQPLYLKAAEIVAADPHKELSSVVVRLGGFHLILSFLGAIGYIMSDSGLETLWEEVYAKNSVVQMLNGHAYSRAIRAHYLAECALTSLILGDCENLKSLKEDLFRTISDALEDRMNLQDLEKSEVCRDFYDAFEKRKDELREVSPTAALWIQYLDLLDLVFLFLRAERTANWKLHLHCIRQMLPVFHATGHLNYAKSAHLYYQQMTELEEKNPKDYLQLINAFTIRRNTELWGAIPLDLTIEQSVMRLLKVQGGLTHGRGVSDSQLARFVHSFPSCMKMCEAVERLTGQHRESTEQHAELRDSRKATDEKDFQKFEKWLVDHTPWIETDCLRSLSTGVVGDKSINCHQVFSVGTAALEAMIDGNFAEIKLKRKSKVLPLASVNKKIILKDEVVPVNTKQLFMRILLVINNTSEDIAHYWKYELAPKPPALFDDISMRKTDKSKLLDLFPKIIPDEIPQPTAIVIDGGYLLYALTWPRPATFGIIIEGYFNFVLKNYKSSSVTIVFDGYGNIMSTKNEEHKRRAFRKYSTNLKFDENTTVTVTQADFLANEHNKRELIKQISAKFSASENPSISVIQAEADADVIVVKATLEKASEGSAVQVVANDTDVIVLLTALADSDMNISVVDSSRAFVIRDVQKDISTKKDLLLFCHAISGCDTTSALYFKGKKKIWKLLEQPAVAKLALKFSSSFAEKNTIAEAGERILIRLYSNGEKCESLDELRYLLYKRTIARQPVTASFELASLPPTSAAAAQHSFRTYFQVQEWLGNNHLKPTDWGWTQTETGLSPVATTLPPAPENILNLIHCGCKKSCAKKCTCRSSGLNCSELCFSCRGRSCENSNPTTMEDDDEEEENVI